MVKCRKIISRSDFSACSHDNLSDFYASSWQRGESPVPMLVIRIFLASLAVAILLWSVIEGPNLYWLTLANFGMVLVTITMLSGLLVSIIVLCNGPFVPESEELPWYMARYWLLFNVSSSIGLLITAIYWILLYEPDPKDYQPKLFWMDVATHGVTSCIMVVELLASRTPVRALHFCQPLGVWFYVALVLAIYYGSGGTDLPYDVVAWRQRRRAIATAAVVGSMAGLLVIYAMLWVLALCRDKVSTAFARTLSHEFTVTEPDRHSMRIV